jgi:glycerol-3-phosphate acyltransferase PlsY
MADLVISLAQTTTSDWATAIAICLLGYFSGSLPFALWVTHWVTGKDIRKSGSHHATATNTMRQAGWAAGSLVLVLDVSKGFVPVIFAVRYGAMTWVTPLTAALAVIGHCWPAFAGFRGGMGLATAGGALLAISPLAFFSGLGMLVSLVLVTRHAARASALTGMILAPGLWFLGLRGQVIWAVAAAGIVIAVRFMRDWRREYRELWLDREERASH